MIIAHHVVDKSWWMREWFGDPTMCAFFAMSGYGVVISYLTKEGYLGGFLRKSMLKLFIPCFSALLLIALYRLATGTQLITSDPLYLVPFSWFVLVLALFYFVFFVVFRYVKTSSVVKVLIVSAFVMVYVKAAGYLGWDSYSYRRCPSFCVGMFVALYESDIRSHIRWWHVSLMLIVGLCILPFTYRFHILYVTAPYWFPLLMFVGLYSLPNVPDCKVVNLLSSISMEVYILQYIPINLVTVYWGVANNQIALPLVYLIVIALAFPVMKLNKQIFNMVAPLFSGVKRRVG